jgi:hypothetical protein
VAFIRQSLESWCSDELLVQRTATATRRVLAAAQHVEVPVQARVAV